MSLTFVNAFVYECATGCNETQTIWSTYEYNPFYTFNYFINVPLRNFSRFDCILFVGWLWLPRFSRSIQLSLLAPLDIVCARQEPSCSNTVARIMLVCSCLSFSASSPPTASIPHFAEMVLAALFIAAYFLLTHHTCNALHVYFS